MQINAFSSKTLGQAIKTIFVIVVLFAIYLILKEKQKNISELSTKLENLIIYRNIILFVVVLLLTPLNWACEALKWQKLASKIENISFLQAYRGVLVGLSMSTATPLMLGDYAGKILMLKSDKRAESIGAIILGNGMQTFVSIIFGWMGYAFFIYQTNPEPLLLHLTIIFILGVAILFGFWVAFRLQRAILFLQKIKIFASFIHYIQVLENYSFSDIRSIFTIAILRYLVFSLQFYA